MIEHPGTNQIQKMLGDHDKPYAIVGIPSWLGMLDPEMLACFTNLKYFNWAQGILIGESHGTGSMIADNRNKVIIETQKTGAKYLLLCDTDMIFPHDSIQRMAAHNKPIVSALAFSKVHNSIPNMYRRICNGTWQPIIDWDDGTLLKVDCVGGAFMLIDMEAIQHIPAPWFAAPPINMHTVYNAVRDAAGKGADIAEAYKKATLEMGGNTATLGEDFYFSELMAKYDVPIYVDTSLKIGHVGRYPYGYHNFKAAKDSGALDHFKSMKVSAHDA